MKSEVITIDVWQTALERHLVRLHKGKQAAVAGFRKRLLNRLTTCILISTEPSLLVFIRNKSLHDAVRIMIPQLEADPVQRANHKLRGSRPPMYKCGEMDNTAGIWKSAERNVYTLTPPQIPRVTLMAAMVKVSRVGESLLTPAHYA